MIIDDKAFSPSYDLVHPALPLPPAPPPLQSPVELSDGGGGEGVKEEPNHTTARKPGPL
jgi:hypothetical protein